MATFVTSDPAGCEVFMGRWTSRLAGPFLEFAGIRPGQQVLDVGCGTVVITAAAADLGATTVGLDPSETYLDFARRQRSRPNASFEVGDAHHIGYPDAAFDAAVSTLALDVRIDRRNDRRRSVSVVRPSLTRLSSA
jgi:2-polyprenyl-3-methyl-5-hydroxy-6-metoxy-1,4-benzoquinol methylase